MARPGPRSRRDGRRRQLPDAQLRDRDVGDARPQARRSSCSTTAATAASTGCSRRSAARRSTTCSTTACRAATARRAIDFAAHARSLGALAEHVTTIAELEAALQRARAARPHVRHRHRHRSGAHDGGRRLVVGGRRAGGLGARTKCARRASSTSTASGGSSHERSAFARTRLDATHERRDFDVRIGINPISWSNDDLPSLGGETPLETALVRRQGDRLRGLRARQQVSARAAGAARRARAPRARAASPAGTRAGSRGARSTRRSRRSARICGCSPRTART